MVWCLRLHWESSFHAPHHGQASLNTLKNKPQVWVKISRGAWGFTWAKPLGLSVPYFYTGSSLLHPQPMLIYLAIFLVTSTDSLPPGHSLLAPQVPASSDLLTKSYFPERKVLIYTLASTHYTRKGFPFLSNSSPPLMLGDTRESRKSAQKGLSQVDRLLYRWRE